MSEIERNRRLFPGLAVKDPTVPPVSDAFLQEPGDPVSGQKTRPYPTDEPAPKHQRRSPSPPRRRSPSPRGRLLQVYDDDDGSYSMDNTTTNAWRRATMENDSSESERAGSDGPILE